MSKSLYSKVSSIALIVVVLENKGGVGKSLAASLAAETLANGGKRVQVCETDTSNSVQAMTRNASLINVKRTGWEGELYHLAERLVLGEIDHAVVDTGARDEATIKPILPGLAKQLHADGNRLVVVRLITPSHFAQANTLEFVRSTMTPDMGVVAVRNLGQGRSVDDFEDWMRTDARAEMLQKGMVECDLADAGTRWSDQATSCGLTLADAAMARFHLAHEDERPFVEQVFTRPVQLFLLRWLEAQTETFRGAFSQAIARTNNR